MLGTATLLVSTLLYLWMWQIHAPLWGWAIASILLGLGFTFFSGATEAWLVDALAATGFTGHLEHVFGRAQTATGAAMLIGTVAGGAIAQVTNLGVPYILRAVMLGVTMVVALVFMRDIGFTPRRDIGPVQAVRNVVRGSIDSGFRNPPVRWLMLADPVHRGHRHLPVLRRAAVPAGAVRRPHRLQHRRPGGGHLRRGADRRRPDGAVDPAPLPAPDRCDPRRLDHRHRLPGRAGPAADVHGGAPAAGGVVASWSPSTRPMRQAYLNGVIPSEQRATVLSFDSLMGSAGGVVAQPVLGRVADVSGYAASYMVAAGIQVVALPFVLLARREHAPSDPIEQDRGVPASETVA